MLLRVTVPGRGGCSRREALSKRRQDLVVLDRSRAQRSAAASLPAAVLLARGGSRREHPPLPLATVPLRRSVTIRPRMPFAHAPDQLDPYVPPSATTSSRPAPTSPSTKKTKCTASSSTAMAPRRRPLQLLPLRLAPLEHLARRPDLALRRPRPRRPASSTSPAGYGRVTRFLARDLPPERVWVADVYAARRPLPGGALRRPRPRLDRRAPRTSPATAASTPSSSPRSSPTCPSATFGRLARAASGPSSRPAASSPSASTTRAPAARRRRAGGAASASRR